MSETIITLLLKSLKISSAFTFLQVIVIYIPYLFIGKIKRKIISQLLFFNVFDFILSGIYLFIVIFIFQLLGIVDDNSLFKTQHPVLYFMLGGFAMTLANSFFALLFPIILKNQTNRLEVLPKYSQLLQNKFGAVIPVYTTKKKCINAFAIGFFSTNKIIVLGNELIANCDEDEIEAILFHEYAHHKNKDLIHFYLLLIFSCLFFLFFRENFMMLLKSILPLINEGLAIAIYGGLYGLIFSIIFSRISHNAEYNADSFSAQNTSNNSMVEALRKISFFTEHLIDKGGMTHPSLIKRIDNIIGTKK
ncbi:M48 family metallopeptidase [Flavobacterium taihuense]|uniref:M48 family metalloprotease n=1 Tax=Flavobacterium taihuense TaxID=2857508 RepID=A0ABS6XU59_9FLAO|nr:M48 family metallopeptidase [Flavobacterium taihuense]MBW4360197.1 M48 family metalloprotease [Flavobacterium taihuense]